MSQRSTVARVTRRLIPFAFLCYVIAYIDRVNVGFAAPSLQRDLGISATHYGIGAGLFFLGYFLFEIPSNLILERVGARRWIARIMIVWGFVSMGTIFAIAPSMVRCTSGWPTSPMWPMEVARSLGATKKTSM